MVRIKNVKLEKWIFPLGLRPVFTYCSFFKEFVFQDVIQAFTKSSQRNPDKVQFVNFLDYKSHQC